MSSCKIYHRRPWNMAGSILYPLNALEQISPDSHRHQRAKYEGREALLQQRVAHLDCLWNDVLHLSPVHPGQLAQAAREAGLSWTSQDWFEIDPVAAHFTPANTVLFRYEDIHTGLSFSPNEFEPFDLQKLARLAAVPQTTRDYYQSVGAGGRFLLFVGVPHVMHRGPINTEGLAIINS